VTGRVKSYKFLVVGFGNVGKATALVLRVLGHEVWVHDINPSALKNSPVEVKVGLNKNVDAAFVCTHEKDVFDAVEGVNAAVRIAVRSTTPPGTVDELNRRYGNRVSHIPEFLRERYWFSDALRPWRIVIGECCKECGDFYEEVFKPLGVPIVRVSPIESELIKLVNNAYLTTLISFWNEIHELCRKLGVETSRIAEVVKLDPRVSSYGADFFGRPFGGRCLSKDLDNIISAFKRSGLNPELLEAVREINEKLKKILDEG
jgi:UDPglucose 6-dehydrogenase